MSEWIVTIPVWGEYHNNTLERYTLPSLHAAVKYAGCDIAVNIIRDPPQLGTPHETLSACHRQAVNDAKPGQRVMLLNADMVLSREVFEACEWRFRHDWKLIVACATRCLLAYSKPPIGADSQQLLDWTLRNKHPSVHDCFWGTGRTVVPWALYFASEHGVVVRGFHLHPVAFVKTEGLGFRGASIDVDLVDQFAESEIHTVTYPTEMSLAELSPASYVFPSLPQPITTDTVYGWARHHTTPKQRWLFEKRILISGTTEDNIDLEPCDRILKLLDRSEAPMQWIISIPCWGDYHVGTMVNFALPALVVAIREAGIKAKIIVHTDDDRLRALPSLMEAFECDAELELRPVTHGETHHDTYGNCHRDVVRSAEPGERVALLNADIVVSREVFSSCEHRFTAGKKLVIAAATRCLLKEGVVPLIGARSRELLAWTMGGKHPCVAECFWHTGRSMIPWAIYFESDKGVVIRGFHLHPLAFVKRKDLPPFKGTSLDEHLVEEFTHDETHVVVDPDELGLAELSPRERQFKLLDHPLNEKAVFAWAQHRATDYHRWLFTHRIVVYGTGEDQSDIEPCNVILEKLRYSRSAYNGPLPRHFTQCFKDGEHANEAVTGPD